MDRDEIIDGYMTTVQVTCGEIIDIYPNFTNEEKAENQRFFEKLLKKNKGSILVMSLRDAVSYAKEHPIKGFFLDTPDSKIIRDFLYENGVEESMIKF